MLTKPTVEKDNIVMLRPLVNLEHDVKLKNPSAVECIEWLQSEACSARKLKTSCSHIYAGHAA